jgi:dynein heavy chain
LEGTEVIKILRFLEVNKSTYTNPFSKLQREVAKAREEANDNNRFLDLLKDSF